MQKFEGTHVQRIFPTKAVSFPRLSNVFLDIPRDIETLGSKPSTHGLS